MKGRIRSVLGTVVPPIVVAAVFIGVWLVVSYEVLSPRQRFLLPPPQRVIRVGFLDFHNLSEVLRGLWSTTQVALVGLFIAVALGLIFAILMAQARWIERSFYPYAVVLQTIPILAIVPLIGFWFQFGFSSRVLVCVLISLFPIITNTLFGLQSVDRGLLDLFRLHGAGRVAALRKLQLPAAVPAMFAGFRISAGLSVIGAIVGDFFFRQGEPGIGRLIDIYRSQLASERLFTAIFFSSLLGLAVFWVFDFIGNRAIRSWHDSAPESR
jgi:NitT/TauT family transport system permease protein